MDRDRILASAARLGGEQRGDLAVALCAILRPLLQLDDSPLGQERREYFEAKYEVLKQADGAVVLLELIQELETHPEIDVDEEPPFPQNRRVDFVACLIYAAKFVVTQSDKQFWNLVTTIKDTLYFMTEDGFFLNSDFCDSTIIAAVHAVPDVAARGTAVESYLVALGDCIDTVQSAVDGFLQDRPQG